MTHGIRPLNTSDFNSKRDLSVRQPSFPLIGGEDQEARPQTRVAVFNEVMFVEEVRVVTGGNCHWPVKESPLCLSARGENLFTPLTTGGSKQLKREMSNLKTPRAATPA